MPAQSAAQTISPRMLLAASLVAWLVFLLGFGYGRFFERGTYAHGEMISPRDYVYLYFGFAGGCIAAISFFISLLSLAVNRHRSNVAPIIISGAYFLIPLTHFLPV